MASQTFSLTGESVVIAMPINRDMPLKTCISLLKTQSLMAENGIHLEFVFISDSSMITAARTRCVAEFLKTKGTLLFWLDSDMAWNAADFLKLVCYTPKLGCVGATYPQKKEPIRFALMPELGENVSLNDYGCVSVRGMGLGFACVRRDIVEQLSANARKLKFPQNDEPLPAVFREGEDNGDFMGEDMAFFADIRALGHTVWMCPQVHLEHIGAKSYAGSFMDQMEQFRVAAAA